MEHHIKINLEAFKKLDDDFLRKNRLKYSLFHNGELVEVLNDLEDAYKYGNRVFPNRDFFIKQILAPAGSLGIMGDRFVPVC